jgi:adenine-specific DNA-methyltransferase
MTVAEIRNILEAPYDRTVWKSFIQTQFTNNQLAKDDYTLQLGKSDLYTECYSLGHYAVDDYTKIGIFEVQLTKGVNLIRNRVGLRNLIKDITKQVAGAMVVFVQEDKWRFSYISKRKVRNKETNTIRRVKRLHLSDIPIYSAKVRRQSPYRFGFDLTRSH